MQNQMIFRCLIMLIIHRCPQRILDNTKTTDVLYAAWRQVVTLYALRQTLQTTPATIAVAAHSFFVSQCLYRRKTIGFREMNRKVIGGQQCCESPLAPQSAMLVLHVGSWLPDALNGKGEGKFHHWFPGMWTLHQIITPHTPLPHRLPSAFHRAPLSTI